MSCQDLVSELKSVIGDDQDHVGQNDGKAHNISERTSARLTSSHQSFH